MINILEVHVSVYSELDPDWLGPCGVGPTVLTNSSLEILALLFTYSSGTCCVGRVVLAGHQMAMLMVMIPP